MIYLLTAIGLTHGGSSTVHIYTQTILYSAHTTYLHALYRFVISIYLLTSIGLTPGGSSTVQYTFTNKQFYILPTQLIYMLFIFCDMIYLLTAIRLTPGGSSTVNIYTQTIHRTIELTN